MADKNLLAATGAGCGEFRPSGRGWRALALRPWLCLTGAVAAALLAACAASPGARAVAYQPFEGADAAGVGSPHGPGGPP